MTSLITTCNENPDVFFDQQNFNELIIKIECQQNLLTQWENISQQINCLISSDYRRAWHDYNQQRLQLLYLLDAYYDQRSFKHHEKAKMGAIIEKISYSLIYEHQINNPKLAEIYHRYQTNNLDEDTYQTENAANSAAENETLPELEAKLAEKLRAKADYQQQRKAKQKTKPAATAAVLEDKTEVDNQKVLQSLFRQLVSVIHPDRELNEKLRARKTVLMQQVNTAYANKNLWQLLMIQTKLAQFSVPQTPPPTHLQQLTQLLQTQTRQLQQKITSHEQDLKYKLGLNVAKTITPKQTLKLFKRNIKNIESVSWQLQADLKLLCHVDNVKLWLKSYSLD